MRTSRWRWWSVGAVFALAAAVIGVSSWAQVTGPGAGSPVLQAVADRHEGPSRASTASNSRILRFAAVGDSITQGDSGDFSAGWTGRLSWVTYARSPALVFAGGWAAGGATSARMAANVHPVKADVLVILAGTNDLAQQVPFWETVKNFQQIAATVGAARVVVSAIPPRDSAPGVTEAFNAALRDSVLALGWQWVDAPAGLRDGSRFTPGLSYDGVHPNQAGAEILGRALAEVLSPPAQ